ncbi:hypothetical protein [Candidatus Odyssella acanthamoebae]|uniref:hypothetical protein n=1 Tax=Candidatus Odyssella acanthamoebae TaxID=91604 RepID=UPI00068AEF29|nr:hypothetical protein [Candidatus Paracaedibacter acanthamoebae]
MVSSRLCSSPHYVFVDSQLVRSIGMTAASLLSRIHYWLQKDKGGIIHDEVKFVYNTALEWSRQLGVSSRQVERAIAKLRNLGLLRIEKLARHKSIRTNHYAINYEALQGLISLKKAPKMSESSRQNVGMYITKNTDNSKDINNNKSKTPSDHSAPQVQQVLEIKNKRTEENSKTATVPNTTVQDMVTYWQQLFPHSTVKLNRELSQYLHAAFKLRFNSDMNLWRHYCQTLESSPYLTSKDFNLTLGWVIKFKTIDRIKAGELGVKAIAIPGETQRLEAEIKQEIACLDESELCKSMRIKLLKLYGVHAYNAWIRKARLLEEGKRISYQAETDYGQSFIENHFGRLIVSCPPETPVFEEKRKSEFAKGTLLEKIDHIDEAEKWLHIHRIPLEPLGLQHYMEQFHCLSFSLEKGGMITVI